jgi:predicted TIM-barrel fold metal-dependent hydrolase
MVNAPYTPSEYGQQLVAAAERFPDLKIGLYHAGFGLPNMLEKEATIRTVKRYDNLYMSTALFWVGDNEYPFRSYMAIIEELAQRVGVEKLMWATDWPWTEWFSKYRQMVTAVQNHATFLSDAEKARFMGGTAMEFLDLT